MRTMTWLVVVGACGAMAGCAGRGPSAMGDPDGVACGSGNGGRVYIEILYAGDGKPSAQPDQCTVASGTVVTWRTAMGETRPFELQFAADPAQPGSVMAAAGAMGEEERMAYGRSAAALTVDSSAHDGRQRAGLTTRVVTAPTTYKYSVMANGMALDPAISVTPR